MTFASPLFAVGMDFDEPFGVALLDLIQLGGGVLSTHTIPSLGFLGFITTSGEQIGRIHFRAIAGGNGFFALDNVAGVVAPAAPVPEPTSLLLLGTGVLACGHRAWRMRRMNR